MSKIDYIIKNELHAMEIYLDDSDGQIKERPLYSLDMAASFLIHKGMK